MAVMAVAQEKEISDMLLNSLARIVDRYALCDIENDTYEYHERMARRLYPERGSYGDLVEAISNRYTLLSGDENRESDEVLRNVGKRILNSIRNDDYVFRLGGDEFACIIGGNPDEKNCLKSIERLEKNICSPYNIHGHKIQIGVSCGYAVYPSDGDTVECMLKIADSRMYSEKEKHHAGRILFPAQPQV